VQRIRTRTKPARSRRRDPSRCVRMATC